MLTTSLLVSGTSDEGRGIDLIDDPKSTEVAVLTPSLVEDIIVTDCVIELPSAEVGVGLTDKEGPAVEGAGSDTIVDMATVSGFELVTATKLLELRTSSVSEGAINVVSKTVECIVGSELVTCKRLDNVVTEI